MSKILSWIPFLRELIIRKSAGGEKDHSKKWSRFKVTLNWLEQDQVRKTVLIKFSFGNLKTYANAFQIRQSYLVRIYVFEIFYTPTVPTYLVEKNLFVIFDLNYWIFGSQKLWRYPRLIRYLCDISRWQSLHRVPDNNLTIKLVQHRIPDAILSIESYQEID